MVYRDLQDYIPKMATQQAEFLQIYPERDGRGLLIAIIDRIVDISLPGLQKTTTGIPKIFDCFDFGGAGNVDTSMIKEADENNIVIGLSGRSIKIPSTWKNPSNKWHLGKKSFHELSFRKPLQPRQKIDEEIFGNIFEDKPKPLQEEDLMVDIIVWFDGKKWQACGDIGLSEEELKNAKILTNYHDEHEYAFINDKISYCITVHDNGNLLEIYSSHDNHHGTAVSQVAAANFPDEPERNGLAPGAQIVLMNVIIDDEICQDTVKKALLKCIELKVDVLNISQHIYNDDYEEVNEILKEMTEKHGIIIVKSAGNYGPLHFSLNYNDGLYSEHWFIIGSIITSEMKNQLFGYCGKSNKDSPNVLDHSSRGPLKKNGSRGITFTAPGAAVIAPPRWYSSNKNQEHYGTSFAAPISAGSIACLISALKDNSIPYSPDTIKLALSNTAFLPAGGDKLEFGEGIIQIYDAFVYFKTFLAGYCSTVNFAHVSIEGSSDMKGILLIQEKQEFVKTYKIKIHQNSDAAKIPWILKTFPKSKINFVKYSKIDQNNVFSIEINSSSLEPGSLQYAEIHGLDSSNPSIGPLFHLPITVILPEKITKNYQKNIFLKNGISFHLFFQLPNYSRKCKIVITAMDKNFIKRRLDVKYSPIDCEEHQPKKFQFFSEKVQQFEFSINDQKIYELSITSATETNDLQNFKLAIYFEEINC